MLALRAALKQAVDPGKSCADAIRDIQCPNMKICPTASRAGNIERCYQIAGSDPSNAGAAVDNITAAVSSQANGLNRLIGSCCKLRLFEHGETGEQAGEARRPQRNERLCRLPTLSLQDAHRVMADAVDGKDSAISSADEARQQRRAVLDSAIMIE
jgi:hypothetical protein